MGWVKQGNLRPPPSPGGDGAATPSSAVAQADGTYYLDTIAPTTFYGARFNPATGRLVMEVAAGDGVVSLPQEGIIRPLDYTNWVFTTARLTFSWRSDERSHLTMGVA